MTASYYFSICGTKTAERHLRMMHGLSDKPELGIWRPYTVIVQTACMSPYRAFYSVREFKLWLGARKFTISRGRRNASRYSVASGWIE